MTLSQVCDRQELVKPFPEEQESWEEFRGLQAAGEGDPHILESSVSSLGVRAWVWPGQLSGLLPRTQLSIFCFSSFPPAVDGAQMMN